LAALKFCIFEKNQLLKKTLFKLLAKLNKMVLPSFAKRQLDLSKASKLQMAIIGWRYFVTTNALD
jgi:hypothetical protein